LQLFNKKTRYQQIAEELGFNGPTNSLPIGLQISKASFYRLGDDRSKVVAGEDRGCLTAVFDFNLQGESGYQTIVAMKSSAVITDKLPFLWRASEIKCERLGDWIILFREKEEIATSAVPEFVEACRGLVGYFESLTT
jgi:hypothetical protein